MKEIYINLYGIRNEYRKTDFINRGDDCEVYRLYIVRLLKEN
jgi:hypothetical protein